MRLTWCRSDIISLEWYTQRFDHINVFNVTHINYNVVGNSRTKYTDLLWRYLILFVTLRRKLSYSSEIVNNKNRIYKCKSYLFWIKQKIIFALKSCLKFTLLAICCKTNYLHCNSHVMIVRWSNLHLSITLDRRTFTKSLVIRLMNSVVSNVLWELIKERTMKVKLTIVFYRILVSWHPSNTQSSI